METAGTIAGDRPFGRRNLLVAVASALMVGMRDKAEADEAAESTQAANGRKNGAAPEEKQLIKPAHLRKGDTIGIVAPSSPMDSDTEIEFTFQWLKKLGLKYKLGKHLFDSYSDFAGPDEARLEDFHNMWADKEVKAIMPLRGGNGAARLLPKLNFDLIAKNPKIIIGYSDATGLLIPIHQKTGLVTFHGPMMGSFFEGPYTYHNYIKALMSPRPLGLIADNNPKEPWSPEGPPTRFIIREGKAKGRLTGGCMTLIKQLMGTPYEMETAGKIVFLEDLDDEPHGIDRFLTQLLLAGSLQKAAAVIIGECTNCRPGGSGRRSFPLNFNLDRVLKERLGNLGIPVVYGLRFGHSKQKFTIPLGVTASLDAGPKGVVFKIEESATT
ncbi:MAG TPA: LD-carboxypeptidase [Candidatus Obscuribacterales bacterium]